VYSVLFAIYGLLSILSLEFLSEHQTVKEREKGDQAKCAFRREYIEKRKGKDIVQKTEWSWKEKRE
jgi:hypothetical protein